MKSDIEVVITLKNKAGETLARAEHKNEADLYIEREYEDGDFIEICGDRHMWVQMDPGLLPGEVYLPEKKMTWTVPLGERLRAYSPAAVRGKQHVVSARVMDGFETGGYRCISRNPSDLRGDTDFFPHCTANVVTRDESCFAPRNVIDGYILNKGHGDWPYQSWGIGKRTDAKIELDLGREVSVEAVAVVLRGDFPHDTYWTDAVLTLEDGEEIPFKLEKSLERQWIDIGRAKRLRRMKLDRFVKSDEPSEFPSLIQWEVYGRD